MHYAIVRYIEGMVLKLEAVLLLLPALTGLLYQEREGISFLIMAVVCLGLGFLLTLKKPLEALIDSVIYRYEPHNIAEREWFSDHLYELMNSHDLDADYEIEEEQSITMQ